MPGSVLGMTYKIGHVLGIYTSNAGTMILVLRYIDAPSSVNRRHPLVCSTKEIWFKSIPNFQGYPKVEMFRVLYCSYTIELWPLKDVSGHVMCIPEVLRIPIAGEAAASLSEENLPTPIIFDISASARGQQAIARE